nr:unnamed protein product [Callosobruchus analis]
MSLSDFDTILVGSKIAKKDTTFRKSSPISERSAITLRYLASGDSFKSLLFLFPSRQHRIVH